MQLSNIPGKLVLPFANSGGKSTIPVASQIGITAGAASLTDGFPPLTRTPIAAGGVPPSGFDMNGILYEMSAIVRWANAGGGYPFDSAFATDANVGGYPKGARVMRSDGTGYWFNTAENNVTDPESSGAAAAGWVPDFSTGVSAVTMTGSSVTLTPAQYGKPTIAIAGAMTADLNLIFPTIPGQWVIVNGTTGGFTINAKTAAGSSVPITPNFKGEVFGDGTNITHKVQDLSGADGADGVGFTSARTSAEKMRDIVCVFDVMSKGQIADVKARTVTIDTIAAFNEIVTALGANGGMIHAPKGRYLLTAKLHLPTGVSLIGDGQYGGPDAYDQGITTLYGLHDGMAIVSLTGSVSCMVSDLCIQSGPAAGSHPQTGLLLGRTTSASAGYHKITRVAIYGNYKLAPIFSIASEDNYWEDINVWLYGGTAKWCFYTSIGNSFPQMTDPLYTSSNLDNVFVRFWFTNSVDNSDAACIYIDGAEAVGSWTFYGGYLTAFSGSYVTIGNGAIDGLSMLGPITFVGLNGERLSGGDPIYGFKLTAGLAVTLPNLTIFGCRLDFLAGTNHYQIWQSSNLSLTQPNITIKPPEAFPYAQILLHRNKILGGTMNVGRFAAWQAATLASGWANSFGAPYPAASYSIDSTGRLSLRGTVTGGTGTILTLPDGYRPPYTLRFPTMSDGAIAMVSVNAAGEVTLIAGTAGSVELGGIQFSLTEYTL
jgi:hypothetical protein